MYTSSSIFNMAIKLLFNLITYVNFFPIHEIDSLLKMLLLFFVFICLATTMVIDVLVTSTEDLKFNIIKSSKSNK